MLLLSARSIDESVARASQAGKPTQAAWTSQTSRTAHAAYPNGEDAFPTLHVGAPR